MSKIGQMSRVESRDRHADGDLKIEDDNPRQFDQVQCRSGNVKNAKFDWTRIACLSSLPTFSRRVRTLLTQGGPILSVCAFRILATCKTYCNQTSIWDLTYYQSTPLCQNKFGPRKSNLLPLYFFKQPIFFLKSF